MKNNRVKYMIGAAIALVILAVGFGYYGYLRAHTFTLSGDEQIQCITGTVQVSSPEDTSVIFIDAKTGDNYAIPFIASGQSETINLEKGKWYSVEDGAGLTMRPVNTRTE